MPFITAAIHLNFLADVSARRASMTVAGANSRRIQPKVADHYVVFCTGWPKRAGKFDARWIPPPSGARFSLSHRCSMFDVGRSMFSLGSGVSTRECSFRGNLSPSGSTALELPKLAEILPGSSDSLSKTQRDCLMMFTASSCADSTFCRVPSGHTTMTSSTRSALPRPKVTGSSD